MNILVEYDIRTIEEIRDEIFSTYKHQRNNWILKKQPTLKWAFEHIMKHEKNKVRNYNDKLDSSN